MSNNTLLDQKYAQLVDQLTQLNAKLDQFINGNASVVINTNSGQIKSLTGIVADVYTKLGLPIPS